MRSGSTFLGEALQAQGFPYYNELFTPEICRRSNILPRDLDDNISAFVLDQVWSQERAGFKMIYGQATPDVWARLVLARFVKVIHLVRDDVLEQYSSVQYLERVGVSARVDGVCLGTDGKEATPDLGFRMRVDPDHFRDWLERNRYWREFVWRSFRDGHDYQEIPFPEVFTEPAVKRVCFRLNPNHKHKRGAMPGHKETPRPRARDMITNMEELRREFRGTDWERVLE